MQYLGGGEGGGRGAITPSAPTPFPGSYAYDKTNDMELVKVEVMCIMLDDWSRPILSWHSPSNSHGQFFVQVYMFNSMEVNLITILIIQNY